MSQTIFGRLSRHFGPRADVISRREALKAAMAASAGLLAAGALPALGRQPTGPRALVIGAGFGGLAAAYQLAAHRWDVQVIEARERLGGRVLSLGGLGERLIVEGGGEFFGSNHPLLLAFLNRLDIKRVDVVEDETLRFPVRIGGMLLSEAQAEALYHEMDAALNTMNDDAAKVNADEPWLTPGAADLDRRTVENWISGLSTSDLCKTALRVQLAVDNGVETTKQSYLGQLAMVKGGGVEKFWTDSELYRCRGGNAQIAGSMGLQLGRGRLTLGVRATRIETTDAGVKVTCSDGQVREADHVIVAVAPSVWGTIEFVPALPASLAWQMGRNVKFISVFGSPFWKQSGTSPSALSDGPVSMTWQSGDVDGPSAWALTAFSGAAAADACRAAPEGERAAFYRKEIESLIPGYSEHVLDTRFMDWPGDPLTRGSYSFPAPGQVMTSGPILRNGLGRLHFAGEHACPKFVGYMEGAITSGVDLARRLTSS